MSGSKALSRQQIFFAALVVLIGFLASGVLGVVRTAVFSATFGASAELDAFYAAQRIPEMLFTLVAGGALGSSFIPVFSRYLTADDQNGAWRLASSVMTLSASAAAILAILLAILAPILVPALLVPGKPSDQQALTTTLTQLMLITTVIFAISGLLMGILNAHQRFLFPALALSMNNIGLIVGALVIARILPTPNDVLRDFMDVRAHTDAIIFAPNALTQHLGRSNVYGLAIGAVLGAILHLVIQLPGLQMIKARLRVVYDWRFEGVREVMVLMGPRVLGLAIVQINFAVNIAFASTMIEGSLVALNTAWFLMFFTLGIIAQSVGTAVFPSLSALVAENDMDGYKDRLSGAMRSVLFLAFPATVGLMVLGVPLVGALFERGEWTANSTQATAWALIFFALGIAGHSLLEVLSRAFYALADTWTPVKVGVAAMVANIVFSLIFIQFIGDENTLRHGPFAGLALANSLTTLLESAILWRLLHLRIDGVNDRYVISGAGRALFAAIVMGVAVIGSTSAIGERSYLVEAATGALVGVIVFFGLAIAMRLDEVNIFLRRIPVLSKRLG
jgi:putative peptidoglycan lipid II flippase